MVSRMRISDPAKSSSRKGHKNAMYKKKGIHVVEQKLLAHTFHRRQDGGAAELDERDDLSLTTGAVQTSDKLVLNKDQR